MIWRVTFRLRTTQVVLGPSAMRVLWADRSSRTRSLPMTPQGRQRLISGPNLAVTIRPSRRTTPLSLAPRMADRESIHPEPSGTSQGWMETLTTLEAVALKFLPAAQGLTGWFQRCIYIWADSR